MTDGRAPAALRERWWLPPALCLVIAAVHVGLLLLQADLLIGLRTTSTTSTTAASSATSGAQRALTAACCAWWTAAGAFGLARRGRMGRAAWVVLPAHPVALGAMGLLSTVPGVPWCATMALVTLPIVTSLRCWPRLARVVLALSAAGAAATTLSAVGGRAGPEFGAFAAVCTAAAVVVPTVVVMRLDARLRAAATEARRQAVTDPLTGLLNRRGLDEGAARLGAEGVLPGPVCVVVADVDRFKQVNDTFGHSTGDVVLRAVADLLRDHARSGDVLVRHGGEEFAWVGRWPDAAAAVQAAERLRGAVAAAPMPHERQLTVSLGVASADVAVLRPHPVEALHRLLDRADTALYEAKRSGRDRVVVAGSAPLTGSLEAPATEPGAHGGDPVSAGAGAP